MKRLGLLFSVVVAAAAITQSCNKKDDCPFLSPKIAYVNFTEEETDTLIIRKYQNNNLFDQLIDTALIPKADITRTIAGKDSVILSSTKQQYVYFANNLYAYNWEIVLPGNNGQTIRISDITPRFTQEREASAQCQSYVASMNFNGSPYTWTSWFDSQYQVYIIK